MNLLYISNLISVGPLVIYFYLIYTFLCYPNKNYLDIIFAFYILGADYLVKYLKKIEYPKFMYNITRRPEGAKDCDILSRKGKCKKDAGGFPSGHMTTITIFAIFMLLGKYEIFKRNNLGIKKFIFKHIFFVMTNLGIIFITGFARYYKKCHNLFQITGGIFLGSLLAYIFNFIYIRNNILLLMK